MATKNRKTLHSIYLSSELADRIDNIANEKHISFNEVAITSISLGIDAIENDIGKEDE
jgi:predicted transcriptional regulator